MDVSPGTLVGDRYRVVRQLGKGRLGSTYLTEDSGTGREVCLKLVRADHALLSAYAVAARAWKTPAILEPLDVVPLHEGEGGLLTAFVSGGDLRARAAAALELTTVLQWMTSLLDALAVMHKGGWAHGDLKPSNVLFHFDRAGASVVRISDWGLATALVAPSTDSTLATAIDADLYALSRMLHELMTGEPASWSVPSFALVERGAIAMNELVPRADWEVSEDLVETVMRGVDAQRSARWQSAETLRNAIQEELERSVSRLSAPPPSSRFFPGATPITQRQSNDAAARFGNLEEACTKLARAATVVELTRQIPRLALFVTDGAAAALYERDPTGVLTARAQHGLRLEVDAERLSQLLESSEPRLLAASQLEAATPSWDWIAVAPLGSSDASLGALVIAGSAGKRPSSSTALGPLRVFAELATSLLRERRAQHRLDERTSCIGALLAATQDGLALVDEDGAVLGLNDAALELFKMPRSRVVGARLAELPGLQTLVQRLSRSPRAEEDIVSIAGSRVRVRVRAFAGGLALAIEALGPSRSAARRTSGARHTFSELVGFDPKLRAAVRDAETAARTNVPVLIRGESGTGKEMLAQALHNESQRARGPFIGINVAAIPQELLESELFGYEQGAFTGARSGGMQGKFELAAGGTLLLDEIGDMALVMQAALLRVLQERVVVPLGGSREIPIDVRVMATTHRDLEEGVRDNRFRLDLYHRLRVVEIRLPPLRERPDDIPVLIEHFAKRIADRTGAAPIRVTPEVMTDLTRYDWPGNVRELANLVEGWSSLLPAESRLVDRSPTHVRRALTQTASRPSVPPAAGRAADSPIRPLRDLEREAVEAALAAFQGNVRNAATALGVARATLYNMMARYGLRGD